MKWFETYKNNFYNIYHGKRKRCAQRGKETKKEQSKVVSIKKPALRVF